MLTIIIVVILVLLLFGGLGPWGVGPNRPYAYGYGYGPFPMGILGILLVVLLILFLTHRILSLHRGYGREYSEKLPESRNVDLISAIATLTCVSPAPRRSPRAYPRSSGIPKGPLQPKPDRSAGGARIATRPVRVVSCGMRGTT